MVDYREIENLIKALDESSLTSLDITSGELQISMKKECSEKVVYVNDMSIPVINKVEASPVENVEKPATGDATEGLKAIKSPIVGTFYAKPSPDKDTYVSEGDKVKKGQVVCIVEAMKLMNEVKSDFAGEIVKVLVEDGDLIEYGQEIFLVKES